MSQKHPEARASSPPMPLFVPFAPLCASVETQAPPCLTVHLSQASAQNQGSILRIVDHECFVLFPISLFLQLASSDLVVWSLATFIARHTDGLALCSSHPLFQVLPTITILIFPRPRPKLHHQLLVADPHFSQLSVHWCFHHVRTHPLRYAITRRPIPQKTVQDRA
jgi:hypothetical protein